MMRRVVLFVILTFVCGWVHAEGSLPPESIYNLHANLTNQDGKALGLDAYRGHPVLITMFYASCPAVCPLLIDTVRQVESSLSAAEKAELRVLFISIDPERDTPAALKELATTRRVDLSRWTMARAEAGTVRKIAAVLNIQYRKLPNGDFNHASVITLLTESGQLVQQTSTLGSVDPELVAAISRVGKKK